MIEKPKAKMKEDDPKQSEAFRKSLRELEAAGELNRKRGDKVIEDILSKGSNKII